MCVTDTFLSLYPERLHTECLYPLYILADCNLQPGAVHSWSDHFRYILVSSVNRAGEMFVEAETPGRIFHRLSGTLKTIRRGEKKKILNTSVNFVSHFCFQKIDSLCAAAVAHPSVTTSAVSSRRWNDMEIIGTKSLPACHRMQSVLYIHMYWTQTCHRLWQPHSSHTKPILSAAQYALSVPPPSPLLSDSIEMNIRTPRICTQMICFSASHWSQFPETNKPGNYFISEKALSFSRWNITRSRGWLPWKNLNQISLIINFSQAELVSN